MCNVTNRNIAELTEVLNEMAESGGLDDGAYVNSWDNYKEADREALEKWVEGATEDLGEYGVAELIVSLENALGYLATLSQLSREPKSVSDG